MNAPGGGEGGAVLQAVVCMSGPPTAAPTASGVAVCAISSREWAIRRSIMWSGPFPASDGYDARLMISPSDVPTAALHVVPPILSPRNSGFIITFRLKGFSRAVRNPTPEMYYSNNPLRLHLETMVVERECIAAFFSAGNGAGTSPLRQGGKIDEDRMLRPFQDERHVVDAPDAKFALLDLSAI